MFELRDFQVVQILGVDAEKIVNNLCTNDIKKMSVGTCCEAFITNVRGWCVEHGFVAKIPGQVQILGQFGNVAALCSHIDRYIIREDAKVSDLSTSKCAFLLSEPEADRLSIALNCPSLSPKKGAVHGDLQIAELNSFRLTAMSIGLLTVGDVLIVVEPEISQRFKELAAAAGVSLGTGEEFDRMRIAAGWPKSGSEILEKTIPQELDRDREAISFTKGCYLGQETIARLDAIGQLQKKLCVVKIESSEPILPGAPLMKADQQVGQVTSSAMNVSGDVIALAYLRRGNFQTGLQLTCNGANAVVETRTGS